MSENYEDIINHPRHVSNTRKSMSNYDRAAQFAPFAALSGYEEEIREQEKFVFERIMLSEDEINELNDVLNYLKRNDRVVIEYYDGYDYRASDDIFQNYDVIRKELRCKNRKYRLYDLKSIRIKE
ncbi:MAG: YolD-like family protein [Erysipelotrichaceae bacterium]|nr:YolD-like family protein [Erysipelotrichaceae bacterium]